MIVDDKDKPLIALLSANSRISIAELARELKLSRSTVQDRIKRLEAKGIITGYTVRFSSAYEGVQIQAYVMLSINPKKSANIARELRQITAVKSLYAVNGVYDLMAMITAESTQFLDKTLDQIGNINGIKKTVSSIILSTKFEK